MTRMPPVERYVHREIQLPSGVRCSVALEHRLGVDDATALGARMKLWTELAMSEVDHVQFALAWSAYAMVSYPDRYWFIEAWTEGDDASMYQIIQRPRTGEWFKP